MKAAAKQSIVLDDKNLTLEDITRQSIRISNDVFTGKLSNANAHQMLKGLQVFIKSIEVHHAVGGDVSPFVKQRGGSESPT